MPKLPEIRYSTNVQSLGREDISAPGRLAAARVGAARSILEGVKEVERTFAAAEYTKQMSQARNSINELYDTVVSKEAFTSSEIPEFVTGIERHETVTLPDGTEIVRERIIPASEVREQWFKQGMQNITNSAVKGTKTPTARTRISNEMKTQIGPAAYNQLLTYNRAAIKKEHLAIMDSAIQDAVINGDRLGPEGVEAVLARNYAAGLISADDYESRRLAASQDLDIEAYSQEITDAEDTGDLETVWDRMNSGISPTKEGLPSDMTPEQRRALRAHINSQRSGFERQEKEEILETERNGTVLLNNGELTTKWINDQLIAGNIERPAAMALMNSMNTSASGSVKRDTVIAAYSEQILNDLTAPIFGTQISDLTSEWKKRLNNDQFLNGLEKIDLQAFLIRYENNVANNPQYKQATKYISNITGVPENSDFPVIIFEKLHTVKLQKEISNGLLTGLVNYMDEFGADAEPLDWVVKNKDNYLVLDPEHPEKIYSIPMRLRRNFPELGILDDDTMDADAIMAKGFKLYYQPGIALKEQKIFDLWQMLYDTSVDLSMWEDLQ